MRSFGCQQPCPSCGRPLGGTGWKTELHNGCAGGMSCPSEHAEHWLGAWGDCDRCSTEQVAEAVQRMISEGLARVADDYIAMPVGGEPWDVWEFSAYLSKRIAAGDFTVPLNRPLPF